MTARFHLPEEIRFRGATDSIDRAAVEAAVRAGIARALSHSAGEAGDGDARSGGSDVSESKSLSEPFDASRHRAGRSAYTVPSYDDGGAPVELPVEEERSPDRLFTSPGPLEGCRLAVFPHETDVKIRSDRYAVAPNLPRALVWGNLAFGARSFGVLEGPGGFWVAATDERVTREGLGGSARWERTVQDGDGNDYRLRTLVTVEGDPLFPPERELVEDYHREIASTPRAEAAVSRAEARAFLFGDVDRLLAAERPREAASQLAGLGADAFSLLDEPTRTLYLETLLAAGSGEAREIAIGEIIRSIHGESGRGAAKT